MADKWRRSVVLVMTAKLPSSFVVGAPIRNGSENKDARIARSEFSERADNPTQEESVPGNRSALTIRRAHEDAHSRGDGDFLIPFR